jgi:hypothetical protein
LPDGLFDYVYTHSVHRTEVVERFEVDASKDPPALHLYELRYESPGIGMPSDAEGGFRLEEGRFILAMDRSFEKIPVLVSIVPGHGIVAGGRRYLFDSIVRPRELVVLAGRSRRIYSFRR